MHNRYPLLPVLLLLLACGGEPAEVIRFDVSRLDAQGLMGPADGKRALSYEFCIPAGDVTVAQVRAIDPTVQLQRARGRVGCREGQLLAIGHTHQPGFRVVLDQLARLPFVGRIEEAFFE